MIVQRTLAIISAALLVAAVGLATFGPQSVSLGQGLYLIDHEALDTLMAWSNRILGHWAWTSLIEPMLVRPAWLLPASIGIICSGLSMSFVNRKTTHRSQRRS